MQYRHQRFLVTVRSGTTDREFEIVPNLGHYAILENEVTIAELESGSTWTQISGDKLPDELVAELGSNIEQHQV